MHETSSCSLSFAACLSIAFCRALLFVAGRLSFSGCATAVSGLLATRSLTWLTSGGVVAATFRSGNGVLAGFLEGVSTDAFPELEPGDDSVASCFTPLKGSVHDGIGEAASRVACERDLKRERNFSKCLPIALALP